MLKYLDKFVRGIEKDNHPIDIPLVRTEEYRNGMKKYLADSKKWKGNGRRTHTPTYEVTSPKSAKEVADAEGYVKIGIVGEMKFEIKIDELGSYISVKVKFGNEKIGFVRFRRGKNYNSNYRLESFEGLRRIRSADGAPISKQTKKAIADAIAESFSKARAKSLTGRKRPGIHYDGR